MNEPKFIKQIAYEVTDISYSKMGLTYNPGYRVMVTSETWNAGYDSDVNAVAAYLELNVPYEVEYIDIGQSSSTIKLKGIDRTFNSVNFMQVVE